MAKKKEDPLSLKAIKIISIITVVLFAFYAAPKLEGYKSKIQLRNIEIKNDSATNKQLEVKLDRVNSNLDAELEAKESNSQKLQELESQKLQLEQELKKAKDQLQAKLDAKKSSNTAYASPEPSVSGDKQSWMTQAGIPQSEWPYVDALVQKESGWNPRAINRSSGACGLAQALPCSKLGANWADPVHALKWQYDYVKSRYGSYARAKAFWSCIGQCTSLNGTIRKTKTWY